MRKEKFGYKVEHRYRVIVELVSETYFRSRAAAAPSATSSSGSSSPWAFAGQTADHSFPFLSRRRWKDCSCNSSMVRVAARTSFAAVVRGIRMGTTASIDHPWPVAILRIAFCAPCTSCVTEDTFQELVSETLLSRSLKRKGYSAFSVVLCHAISGIIGLKKKASYIWCRSQVTDNSKYAIIFREEKKFIAILEDTRSHRRRHISETNVSLIFARDYSRRAQRRDR